jgi:hypothetical protein
MADTATTAPKSKSPEVSIKPAASLSGILNPITGIVGAVGSFLKNLVGVTLPLSNPLFQYATYDYVISLGCLTKYEVENPDGTYIAGKPVHLVCKSANADPSNRVHTAYGKFDFYVNNVEISHTVGFSGGHNTTFADVKFDIIEPYSMGMFIIACQQLAQELGHSNFREAPFILIIEFRGNKETGEMDYIPNTARYIPIVLTDAEMTVTPVGASYTCSAMSYNQIGQTDHYTKFISDVSAKGTTVQEILQTGEKSVQAIVNQRYRQQKEQKLVKVQDEIVILFPENTASGSDAKPTVPKENNDGATTDPSKSSATSVYEKLGLTRSTKNKTLVQQESSCNQLGKASLGFSVSRKGDVPMSKDNHVWDVDKKVYVRGDMVVNPKETEVKFRQDSDILNAINQVLLNSDFIKTTFEASALTQYGMRNWWRIDIQTYPIGDVEETTGRAPRLIVYRVVPYDVHSSNAMPPNVKAPGLTKLRSQAVKEFNYIYTGKNDGILDFKIVVNNGFTTIMSADGLEKSSDIKTLIQGSSFAEKIGIMSLLSGGKLPSTKAGAIPTAVKYISTLTGSDKRGGGGMETPATRAARLFMDIVTRGQDLVDLDISILGDPYFLVSSGLGNYTSASTQYSNLNYDGTMNYQNGEVDIFVNFRTPVDINQATGMYGFTGEDSTAPVLQYSGLYKVLDVVSTFRDGVFKQDIRAFRRSGYELDTEATLGETFNLSNIIKNIFDLFNFNG